MSVCAHARASVCKCVHACAHMVRDAQRIHAQLLLK